MACDSVELDRRRLLKLAGEIDRKLCVVKVIDVKFAIPERRR
jgi:hypothetical protein